MSIFIAAAVKKNKMYTIYLAAVINMIESLTLDYCRFKKLKFFMDPEKKDKKLEI